MPIIQFIKISCLKRKKINKNNTWGGGGENEWK